MEEYLKIKINLKISGPIDFSKTFVIDYKNMNSTTLVDYNSTLNSFIHILSIIINDLGRSLKNFKYYGFDINYKQDK